MTPDRVAWALCVGADMMVSARGFMFALGCIQAMQCNRNTCPTGITTHDPKLQHGLVPAQKSVRVAQFVESLIKEVGRSEEHTSELQSRPHLVCRLLLEKKKKKT